MSGSAQWLLLTLYALMGGANIARGALAFAVTPVLAPVEPSISQVILGWIYAGWGITLLVIGIGWFRASSARARWILRGAALAYQATVWVIHVVGDRSTQAHSLWPRNLLLTIVFLAVVFLLTSLTRAAPGSRRLPRRARRDSR